MRASWFILGAAACVVAGCMDDRESAVDPQSDAALDRGLMGDAEAVMERRVHVVARECGWQTHR